MTAQLPRFRVTASGPAIPDPELRLVQTKNWQGACRYVIDELTSHIQGCKVSWDNGSANVTVNDKPVLLVKAELN